MSSITFLKDNVKDVITRINPGKDKVSGKFRLKASFLIIALLVLIIVTSVLCVSQRKILLKKSYDDIQMITAEKAGRLNEYFDYLDRLTDNFASDPATAEALSSLSETYANVEDELILTTGTFDVREIQNGLQLYYNAEILPALEQKSGLKFSFEDFHGSNSQSVLQYLYLAGNDRPAGQKHLLNKAQDNSSYSAVHGSWHPVVAGFAAKTGVSDVYLVDYKTGNIVYSYRKNIDYATNLYEGPFSNTALARAFTDITADPSKGKVSYTDMSLYTAGMMQPLFFVASPVYDGEYMRGVAILAINAAVLDDIMKLDSVSDYRSFIVGHDLRLRSNDPLFLKDKAVFLAGMADKAGEKNDLTAVERINTTVLTTSLNILNTYLPVNNSGIIEYSDGSGKRTLASYYKTGEGHPDWSVFTVVNKKHALMPMHKMLWQVLIVTILVFIITCLTAGKMGEMIFAPLADIADKLKKTSEGGEKARFNIKAYPETTEVSGAAEMIAERIDEMLMFVSGLGNENLDVSISSAGVNDRIALSLNDLKDKMIKNREEENIRKKEEEIRNWSSGSLALFNDILRSDHDNLKKLSLNIIRNLIHTLKANQGGLFLIAEEDGKKYLNLEASVAYDRQKFHKKTIEPGEGLAGDCVLEKQTILINKVPDDYIYITSGLGGSRPASLVIVPLKKEDVVMGVIELASFNVFQTHEVEFLEKIAENITETIINVRLNVRNIQLVEQFQQQTEEMKAQEEELRQNIEELRATHEQIEKMKVEEKARMDRMIKEMEDNRDLLIHVLDNIPGKIFVKDKDGVLLLLNSEVARVYHKKVNEMIGTSDFDNHPYEQAKEYREKELEVLAKGGETYIQEETLTGEVRYLQTTKKPFHIPGTGETGLLGFQIDVTESKRLRETIEKLNNEISRLKKK